MQVSILMRDGSGPQIYRILFGSVGGRESQALLVTLSIIKKSWIKLKTILFLFQMDMWSLGITLEKWFSNYILKEPRVLPIFDYSIIENNIREN